MPILLIRGAKLVFKDYLRRQQIVTSGAGRHAPSEAMETGRCKPAKFRLKYKISGVTLPGMTWKHIFLVVTGCALAGMIMGGLFGFASAKITPDFFRHIIPWQDVEPVGIATFFGATAGVVLGGSLGCFGILIQVLLQLRKRGPSA